MSKADELVVPQITSIEFEPPRFKFTMDANKNCEVYKDESGSKVAKAIYSEGGLSKRELAAFMAMQGILSSLTVSRDESAEWIPSTAVKHADSLLAELEKSRETS